MGWGCMSVSKMVVSFLMLCNITRDIVLNERRRKSVVILLHMYLDFNEHKTLHFFSCFADRASQYICLRN